MKKEKIFFLYLKTGGGHLAPARSVVTYLQEKYPAQYETELVNPAEKTNTVIRYLLEDGYRILQASAKWYYELIYFLNKFKPIAYYNQFLMNIFTRKYLEERILAERPDKIVVFHFLSYKPVYDILKKHNLTIPVITAVTDPFTAHPLWFLKKDQNFIVFSQRLKQYCETIGIKPGDIEVFPFIIDAKFSKVPDQEQKAVIRKRFQLTPQDKMILILGGGDGIPHGYTLMKTLLKHAPGFPVAIVCGRNKQLFQQCSELVEKSGRTDVHVFGYVDFVYELIHASEVVITKCGASTFMEIIHSRKLPIIIDYLWEQEKGNVEFLVENGMGIYEPHVKKIPEIIHKLFNNPSYYQSFIERINSQKLENGTGQVAEFIRNFN